MFFSYTGISYYTYLLNALPIYPSTTINNKTRLLENKTI